MQRTDPKFVAIPKNRRDLHAIAVDESAVLAAKVGDAYVLGDIDDQAMPFADGGTGRAQVEQRMPTDQERDPRDRNFRSSARAVRENEADGIGH